jgi:signal transduction histidine kinase
MYRADSARDRASGGTGLGLAIVKGLADSLDAGIDVRSAPGEGSTFRIALPDPGDDPGAPDHPAVSTATSPAAVQDGP